MTRNLLRCLTIGKYNSTQPGNPPDRYAPGDFLVRWRSDLYRDEQEKTFLYHYSFFSRLGSKGTIASMNNKNISFMHWRAFARHPSAFLLAAQLLSLALYAVFEGVPGGRILLSAFGMLVLVLAVWVVIHSPAISWIAWILATPAVVR